MSKGVCFTGHRPEKLATNYSEDLPEIIKLKQLLEKSIKSAIADGFDTFYTGMARGVDILAGEIVLGLRGVLPIRLVGVIPYAGQSDKWSSLWKQRYNTLLNNCDGVFTLSEHYYKGCLFDRNLFMVENSQRVIAVFNGSDGGTKNTIQLAYELAREVEKITLCDFCEL